jgi:hypothetical protein
MAEFLFGFVLGIATNLLSWWILSHLIVPRISFSPQISKTRTHKTQGDQSGYKYRVKIENSGRRAAIDVEIIARLRVKGIGGFPKTNWHIVNIPLSTHGDKSYRIPRILPVKKGLARRHTLRLLINEVEEFRTSLIYPEAIRKKAEEGTLLLEDLLTLGSAANLQILVFAYDEFSGARKLFVSKRYTCGDIKEGPFDRKGLEVKELPTKEQGNEEADLEEDDGS